MGGIEAIEDLDAGFGQHFAHRGKRRLVGTGHSVTSVLQHDRQRRHTDPADTQHVYVAKFSLRLHRR